MDKNFLCQAWSIEKLDLRVKIKEHTFCKAANPNSFMGRICSEFALTEPPLAFEGLCS